MLSTLHIENIAVIEKVDIEFGNGFIVFTGETGAGKSIVIDSIEMLLGSRTAKSIIRTGKDKAYVAASFSDVSNTVSNILKSLDIEKEPDGMLLVERTLFMDGRNICKINGKQITITSLKEVTTELINIHGQNENQKLLNPLNHIVYLDEFAKNEPYLNEYKEHYISAMEIRKKLKDLIEKSANSSNKTELLEYSINEITNAKLQNNELVELTDKKKIAQNTEKIKTTIAKSNKLLNGGDTPINQVLQSVISSFSELIDIKAEYKDIYSRLIDIKYEIQDLSETISSLKNTVDTGEYNIEKIAMRLEVIYKLRQKYGDSIEEILAYRENAIKELNAITNCDDEILELENELEKEKLVISKIADKLTKSRASAATLLEKQIIDELSFLDMPNVLIKVDIITGSKFTSNGKDKVEFKISSNAGESLKPIAKIASGGEISRIMLALKSVLNDNTGVHTLIFDEIDTGVSGKTAEKIGLKLEGLSKNKQVICITHLAQIASLSSYHYLIYKKEIDGKTYTSVNNLDYDEKVKELSRIIGGINITDTIIDAAKEMLKKNHNLE
ncbi:MAG: DNA repair protein RecN [Clostridia bacterium]